MTVASLPPAAAGSGERTSYAQILRSSTLIGGASALNLVVGMLRTKALAMLLGPAGIGLFGVFMSIADLARSAAQLGINASGVRQIAESVGSDDALRIARTVAVLRRVAIVLGLLGMASLIVLSRQVSQYAFGSEQHSAAIAWLSLAVFFRLVADGQTALLQGMRRISELAKIGVVAALAGAVASIALAALLGEDGVVPGLVATAAVSTLISWWYARAVRVDPVCMSGPEIRDEAASLLKLGLAFMASAVLMTSAAFVVRAMVLRQSGVDAAGLYQAAWTLSGMYVGIVLQAMGTDFYPRLVGVINDPAHANRIVNEQTQVSLLLAGPGVIATLVFATPVVTLFYSTDFAAAIDSLRWICLGMALRVVTWPMGYIIVAKNRRIIFVTTELIWTAVNIGLSWVCINRFGLTGAGIAFFCSYIVHGLLVYPIARRLTAFRWSSASLRDGTLFLGMIGFVFGALHLLVPLWATACGAAVLVISCTYSMRALTTLVAPGDLPRPIRSFLARLKGPQSPQENS
jgi:enterobacterial common antigen flippase